MPSGMGPFAVAGATEARRFAGGRISLGRRRRRVVRSGVTDDQARYRAVDDEVFALYEAERYDDALEVLRTAGPGLEPWRADLAHVAACLLAAAGRPAEALVELRAAFDEGAWWHPRILVDDDDLAPLAELDGFAELVRRSEERALAAEDSAGEPIVQRPAGDPKGVLVALHGAGEDAADAFQRWSTATDAGLLVVAVESSQRNTPKYRSWPEAAVGDRDIARALAALTPAERELPLVMAGFSAGGRQALRYGLGRAVAFFVVAPAIGPEQLDPALVAEAVGRGVRGTVLLGEDDDDVGENARASFGSLLDAGMAVELVVVPGLGHAFPADFPDRLAKSLSSL